MFEFITSKADFIKLSRAGMLGNFLQSWNTLEDFEASGYRGHVTIRNKERDSPFFVPSVPAEDLNGTIAYLLMQGARLDTLYFQELPHLRGCSTRGCHGCGRTMNAEVMRWDKYLYLTYGTSNALNLRHDLERHGKIVEGIAAREIINNLSGSATYEALNDIWDRFPNAIIEFSAFVMPVGAFRKRAVIWEAREY